MREQDLGVCFLCIGIGLSVGFDIVAIASIGHLIAGIGIGAILLLHSATIPISILIAVFGEIILIPSALLSPVLFVGGITAWIIGDLQGLKLEAAALSFLF